jgi:hypothetical protein
VRGVGSSCACSFFGDDLAADVADTILAPIMELVAACVRVGVYDDALMDAAAGIVNKESLFFVRHSMSARVRSRFFRGLSLTRHSLFFSSRARVCGECVRGLRAGVHLHRSRCCHGVGAQPAADGTSAVEWSDTLALNDLVDAYHSKLRLWYVACATQLRGYYCISCTGGDGSARCWLWAWAWA